MQTLKHCCESNLPFYTGERCSETKVWSPPERKMAIVWTPKIKAIRVWETIRIAIGCAHHGDDGVALANLLSADDGFLGGDARCVLTGTFKAQQLFHCARD